MTFCARTAATLRRTATEIHADDRQARLRSRTASVASRRVTPRRTSSTSFVVRARVSSSVECCPRHDLSEVLQRRLACYGRNVVVPREHVDRRPEGVHAMSRSEIADNKWELEAS